MGVGSREHSARAGRSADQPFDLVGCGDHIFVFPDAHHDPSARLEPLVCVAISRDVRINLFAPPGPVVLRRRSVIRAAMPEAAVDEYGDPSEGDYDVGGPPGAFDHRPMESESKAAAMEFAPER